MENRLGFPKIVTEYFTFHTCECPVCGADFTLRGREHPDGTKWLEGRCYRGHIYRNFHVDFLQLTNPFYRLLYTNPDSDYNSNKKRTQLEEEQRKADLDKKYFEKYRGTQKYTITLEEKAIRKKVLNED